MGASGRDWPRACTRVCGRAVGQLKPAPDAGQTCRKLLKSRQLSAKHVACPALEASITSFFSLQVQNFHGGLVYFLQLTHTPTRICKNSAALNHTSPKDIRYSPLFVFPGCTKLLRILFCAKKYRQVPHSSYPSSHCPIPKDFHISLNFCNVNVNSVSIS